MVVDSTRLGVVVVGGGGMKEGGTTVVDEVAVVVVVGFAVAKDSAVAVAAGARVHRGAGLAPWFAPNEAAR